MQVSLLDHSMASPPEYVAITESIERLEESKGSWTYMSMTFMQDQEGHKRNGRSLEGIELHMGPFGSSIIHNLSTSNKGPFDIIIVRKWDTLLEIVGHLSRSISTTTCGRITTNIRIDFH